MTQDRLKVGYFGGMANNAYVAAKSAHALGYDAVYIRDLADTFPFSQPLWEDVSLSVQYDDIYNKSWTNDQWHEMGVRQGWKVPSWVVTPDVPAAKKSFLQFISASGLSLKLIIAYLYMRRNAYRHAVVERMKQCDALFVCGIEPEILAWCSGVPYVIWPHGGDIRFAAGLVPHQGKKIRATLTYWMIRLYLNIAYRSALWIGTHDSKGITGEMGDTGFALDHFPMPMPKQARPASKAARHALLVKTMASLGQTVPPAEYYFFVPSRISFFWKKTHILLDAVKKLSGGGRCHFIFSGWGEDYHEMKEKLSDSDVTFLPFSVSKPVVFDLFKSVDLVIDQFYLGAYGTAAVEAMSCEVPVMMYVDKESFTARGWTPPPALNARDEADVTRILQQIVDGDLDLEKAGHVLHRWFLEIHHDAVVIPAFYKKLEQKLFQQNFKKKVKRDSLVHTHLSERKLSS